MPRFRLKGRNRGLEAVLDVIRRATPFDVVFSQGDDVVVRCDREDAGVFRRSGFPCVERQPARYQAAVLDEARAALCWHDARRDTVQAAIADASQYAVRTFAHGLGIDKGCVLAVRDPPPGGRRPERNRTEQGHDNETRSDNARQGRR